MPEKLPDPGPEQLAEAHQVADDAAACAAAFPPADAWKDEFPDLYEEDADGKFRVPYRNIRQTAEENERNSRKVVALLKKWQQVTTDTSVRRDAKVPTVRVRGMDGVVTHVPAHMESKIAEKGTIKAAPYYGKRRTTYWIDGQGRTWVKRSGERWQLDE